jgi:hypothetical protein
METPANDRASIVRSFAIATATTIVPPLEAGLKAAAFGGPLRGSGP